MQYVPDYQAYGVCGMQYVPDYQAYGVCGMQYVPDYQAYGVCGMQYVPDYQAYGVCGMPIKLQLYVRKTGKLLNQEIYLATTHFCIHQFSTKLSNIVRFS